MDSTDKKILELLQLNARISMKELGKLVGLTSPAVSERVKRLEDNKIIIGYRAIVDPDKVNKTIKAFITLSIPSYNYKKFIESAPYNPDIIECHHITGSDSMIIKIMVESMEKLENVIDGLKVYGNTQTNLILSTPIESKIIL